MLKDQMCMLLDEDPLAAKTIAHENEQPASISKKQIEEVQRMNRRRGRHRMLRPHFAMLPQEQESAE